MHVTIYIELLRTRQSINSQTYRCGTGGAAGERGALSNNSCLVQRSQGTNRFIRVSAAEDASGSRNNALVSRPILHVSTPPHN
ncbi:hypothetical protein E2C01_064267 [Portunus trituberculatus]|uniref:Uncharacterized protein n=1 Tax=Portunus trituberculatus TaxID=210409 RepID=A0A5B7HFS2_PORTR|nr:hypothetical protein [Portunus trituberculatus]